LAGALVAWSARHDLIKGQMTFLEQTLPAERGFAIAKGRLGRRAALARDVLGIAFPLPPFQTPGLEHAESPAHECVCSLVHEDWDRGGLPPVEMANAPARDVER